MIVKGQEKTFASNLMSNHRVGLGSSVLHDSAAEEVEQGLLHARQEVSEELGAAHWVHSGPLAEGGIYGSTTSIQLTPRALFGESAQVTIPVPEHYAPVSPWPFGHQLGSAPWTGDVSATLGKSVASRSAHTLGNLLMYFSSLAEAVEQAVEQPHQEAIRWIKTATGFSWERVGRLVGVTRQAVNAWRQGGPMADDHRRRLLEVRDVLERAAKRHSQQDGLVAWLDTPRGADAKTPAELLEEGEVGKARLLALSSASRGVKAPPEWAQQNAREGYLNSRERVRALPPEWDERLLDEVSEGEDD